MASRSNNPRTLLLASAVAGLLAVSTFGGPTTAAAAEKGDTVRCYGINKCKGAGACGGKGHSCAGQNACNGQGYLKLAKETCLKIAGGRLTPEPAK